MKKCSKNKLRDYIVSIFYAFRQGTKVFFSHNREFAANLDPFYFAGVLGVIQRLKKDRKIFLVLIPLIIYAVLQVIALPHISILRLIVNVMKIVICIFVMIYVKDNWKKYSVYRIAKVATILIFVVTVISMLVPEIGVFWRVNDYVNKYNTTRLQGFFLEPSELGFHVIILTIILVSYFRNIKKTDIRLETLILILLNLITLYLARPFGAIVIGTIALLSMLLMMAFAKMTKKRLLIAAVFTMVAAFFVFVAWKMDNPIIMRLMDTVNGSDASNNYRIGVSLKVLARSLLDYHFVGFGFGNLNTPAFAAAYSDLGVVNVVANSFQYFIIEGGLFAIVFLAALWWNLIRGTRKKFTYLKAALLIFLFLYQIFGGHFTSGLIWALYGLCISGFSEEKEAKRVEKEAK